MHIPKSYSYLIGTPYNIKDCWAVVREFYMLQFGVELRPYYEEVPEDINVAGGIVHASKKDFYEVQDRKFGDILLIKLFGVESHIAVYLGNETMLHTSKHSGCIIDRVARWEKLIVGTYRVRNKND